MLSLLISSPTASMPWRINSIIQEISLLSLQFQCISFTWIPRSTNGVAHSLAKWNLSCNFVGSFDVTCCPSPLIDALVKDFVVPFCNKKFSFIKKNCIILLSVVGYIEY